MEIGKISADQAMQQDYLSEFAKDMNFDPYDVNGWYLHAYSIYKRKVLFISQKNISFINIFLNRDQKRYYWHIQIVLLRSFNLLFPSCTGK